MAVSAVHNTSVWNTLDNLNQSKIETDNEQAFDSLFQSALKMYGEADDLQKAAEESEVNFALGYSDNIHDLAIAQKKALISLQYTVKVTNKALEAYKELMNLQI